MRLGKKWKVLGCCGRWRWYGKVGVVWKVRVMWKVGVVLKVGGGVAEDWLCTDGSKGGKDA